MVTSFCAQACTAASISSARCSFSTLTSLQKFVAGLPTNCASLIATQLFPPPSVESLSARKSGASLGKRHIFAEKDEGKLVLRRGFQVLPNEKFVVVEDVVTRGGRVQEAIDIVCARGGIVSAVGVIVDRSGAAKPDFGCPFVSLIEMNVETFPADKLPPDLAKIPAAKPGSK
jgi:orotate phosphoribosyltransferase